MYCYSSKFSVSWFRSFPLSLFLHSFSEWILSIFSVLELKKKFISKADFPVYLSFFNGKRNPTYLTFWTDALILFSRVFHLSVLLFGEFSQFSFCWTFNLGKYLNFKESCLFYIILILLFWKIGLIFCQFLAAMSFVASFRPSLVVILGLLVAVASLVAGVGSFLL